MKIDDYCNTQTVALAEDNGSIDWLCVRLFSIVCASASWLAGCAGQQSALDPAARDSRGSPLRLQRNTSEYVTRKRLGVPSIRLHCFSANLWHQDLPR
jgi:hypothetical protein